MNMNDEHMNQHKTYNTDIKQTSKSYLLRCLQSDERQEEEGTKEST